MGAARPLDFGHWSAHKLEVLSNYRLGHGQAVAIGIALDSFYAALSGLLTMSAANQIASALESVGLSVWDAALELQDDHGQLMVLEGLDEFREHLGGALTVTLPQGIGARVEVHTMNRNLIVKAIEICRDRGVANCGLDADA
jgi:3-dehydroquinate synthase